MDCVVEGNQGRKVMAVGLNKEGGVMRRFPGRKWASVDWRECDNLIREEDTMLGKLDGVCKGNHERTDGGLREVLEAKAPTFDWVIGKKIGQVRKF